MATMTKEQIEETFIDVLDDCYREWTDTENPQTSQEAIKYIQGAFDLMSKCVNRLDRMGEAVEVNECGEK